MVRTSGIDESDRKLLADVEQYGWHLIGIPEDTEGPSCVFSVGMSHTLGHPDLCIFGLGIDTMFEIINQIGELIRSGTRFDDWESSDRILDGYSCVFRQVAKRYYEDYFGYGLWFYEGNDFPMLQVVWPDKNRRYPWSQDYHTKNQPLLITHSDWSFDEPKNLAVITTAKVLEEDHPILLVVHDEEGGWQFLCGTAFTTQDGRIVCLDNIVKKDATVVELADLPIGWQAVRGSRSAPWKRAQVS